MIRRWKDRYIEGFLKAMLDESSPEIIEKAKKNKKYEEWEDRYYASMMRLNNML